MSNPIVKSQVEEVHTFLEKTVAELEGYLNNVTIDGLLQEKSGDRAYYEGVLSNIRRLLVYCEEGLDSCSVVLQNEPFIKGAAEKTLFKVYHQCIEEFFSPRYDLWYEDSRSAYTGKNSIMFRQDLPKSIMSLMSAAESDFQRVREELEYYETDFRTKITQARG
ncbi:YpuI family protein [Rossellomorea vietnamensis]|uniref:YpuI family protein n=1 Tax=Rossellomorea vietnamensis TaxID=218284 RepID=UPI003CF3FC43